MQNTQSFSKSGYKTFDLILTAMLVALVFLSTFLNIKLPIAANGGLVHLGTAMLFIAAFLFGPKKAALAGAIGMALFDLAGGWALWAPITFVSRALEGYIVGKIAWSNGRNGNSLVFNLIGAIASMPVMIGVYYIGEGIMYGNWVQPVASIPGDVVQNILGVIVSLPVCIALKKVPYFKR